MRFYLGTAMPAWLERAGVPLFIQHARLAGRRTLPRAAAPWALDSGAYTELERHGEWRTGRAVYAANVRRFRDEIGLLDWASCQDWLCTPDVLARTGRTVLTHQLRTVDNFCLLRHEAPDLPIVPVLQGWTPDDYRRCADLYCDAGIDLASEPLVGIGSIAGRQHRGDIEEACAALTAAGIQLHGFGVKLRGLRRYARLLASADSQGWSFDARRGTRLPTCTHETVDCRNCLDYALMWRERAITAAALPQQPTLAEAG